MNRRLGIVIIFALIVSVLASTVVYRIISAKLGVGPQSGSSQLLVASRDLPVGTLLSASDIKSVEWRGYTPKRALRSADQVVGRGVLQEVYEGDPMVETRLAPRGAGGGLAATIPHGMRAAAVRVDDIAGVSGFVVPGMKVDVLASGTPPSMNGAAVSTKVSRTVLQNIAVLSAGQNMQRDSEGKPVIVPVINLLVTPEQAELLSLASSEAKIQLVLRNPLDVTKTATRGVALEALFSDGRSAPPVAPPPAQNLPPAPKPKPRAATAAAAPPVPVAQPLVERSRVVEVLHGNDRTQARFSEPLERK